MISPDTIRKALRGVIDPELGLNIIDIGLVYDVAVSDEGEVKITMTLTSPGCPSGAEIMQDAKMVAEELEGVEVTMAEKGFGTRVEIRAGADVDRRRRGVIGGD